MDEGSDTQSGDSTSYDIMDLEEDSSYMIVVTVSNAAGSSSDDDTAMTLRAGERDGNVTSCHVVLYTCTSSSICSS